MASPLIPVCLKKSHMLTIKQYSVFYNMVCIYLAVAGTLIYAGRDSKRRYMSPVKRICVFEHSVMTNFNCACPAIQRGQGSGFLSEGSSWYTAYMSEQRRFWRDCAMRRLAWTFAARIGDKYQIRLTRSTCSWTHIGVSSGSNRASYISIITVTFYSQQVTYELLMNLSNSSKIRQNIIKTFCVIVIYIIYIVCL